MKISMVRRIIACVGIPLAIMALILNKTTVSGTVSIVLLALCAGLVAFTLIFNRCPHCRRLLWRNNGDYCQYCGKPLDDD